MLALLALGAAPRILRATAVSAALTVVLVAVGASAGLLPMGVCLLIATALRTWLFLQTTQAEVQFRWSALMVTLLPSAAVGIAAGIAPAIAFALYGPQPENIWLPLAIGVPGGLVGFVAAIALFKHPLLDEMQSVRRRLGV